MIYNQTNRCNLFQSISQYIWNQLGQMHFFGLDWSELGITDEIIYFIRRYSYLNKDYSILIQKAKNENIRGNDIDLFIEAQPNKYYWFALQAKVLKQNKSYATFLDGSSKDFHKVIVDSQWEKLSKLEKYFKCKAFYLLYNGDLNFSYNGTDCFGSYNQDQFGCTILETNIVANYYSNQIMIPKSRFDHPTFSSFHPTTAYPWRFFTCCDLLQSPVSNLFPKNLVLYELKQILKPHIYSFIYSEHEKKYFQKFSNLKTEILDDVTNSSDFQWEPNYRIFINKR
jgi:hypothetical protein